MWHNSGVHPQPARGAPAWTREPSSLPSNYASLFNLRTSPFRPARGTRHNGGDSATRSSVRWGFGGQFETAEEILEGWRKTLNEGRKSVDRRCLEWAGYGKDERCDGRRRGDNGGDPKRRRRDGGRLDQEEVRGDAREGGVGGGDVKGGFESRKGASMEEERGHGRRSQRKSGGQSGRSRHRIGGRRRGRRGHRAAAEALRPAPPHGALCHMTHNSRATSRLGRYCKGVTLPGDSLKSFFDEKKQMPHSLKQNKNGAIWSRCCGT